MRLFYFLFNSRYAIICWGTLIPMIIDKIMVVSDFQHTAFLISVCFLYIVDKMESDKQEILRRIENV